jgi:hypothetical protein
VVQVERHKVLVELMQVTAGLLKFQAVGLLRAPRLAEVAVVMATRQVLQVDQVAVAVLQARVDLEVKVTLGALAYPITQTTGWAAVAVALVVLAQHQALPKLAQAEPVLRFPGFRQRLEQR